MKGSIARSLNNHGYRWSIFAPRVLLNLFLPVSLDENKLLNIILNDNTSRSTPSITDMASGVYEFAFEYKVTVYQFYDDDYTLKNSFPSLRVHYRSSACKDDKVLCGAATRKQRVQAFARPPRPRPTSII